MVMKEFITVCTNIEHGKEFFPSLGEWFRLVDK